MTTDYESMSLEDLRAEYESAMWQEAMAFRQHGDIAAAIALCDSILAAIGRQLIARYRAMIDMRPELAQMCAPCDTTTPAPMLIRPWL